MEDWFNALWRYTRDLMGKVLGTPGCAGRLSGHGWKLMCEAVVGFGNPAVTNDREPLYPKDGPFAPGGGDVVELVAGGTVMYPEPPVGLREGVCGGDEVRAFGHYHPRRDCSRERDGRYVVRLSKRSVGRKLCQRVPGSRACPACERGRRQGAFCDVTQQGWLDSRQMAREQLTCVSDGLPIGMQVVLGGGNAAVAADLAQAVQWEVSIPKRLGGKP